MVNLSVYVYFICYYVFLFVGDVVCEGLGFRLGRIISFLYLWWSSFFIYFSRVDGVEKKKDKDLCFLNLGWYFCCVREKREWDLKFLRGLVGYRLS